MGRKIAITGYSEHVHVSREGPTMEQIEAQKKAIRLWKNSKSARLDHPYLIRKKIQPHHARQIGESLVIPMQDARGDLWNLQFIHPDGSKRFLMEGRTTSLFTVLGEPSEVGRIFISEGFATGATIHELTSKTVFVAFSDTNLPPVGHIVRRVFPRADIVIAADADPGGESYSERAAREINGSVAYARRA